MEYDFEKHQIIKDWQTAFRTLGTLQIVPHEICAFMYSRNKYSSEVFSWRAARREGEQIIYDEFGKMRDWPRLDVEGIMKLDMDVIMSAVRAKQNVIIYTNTTEDRRWLEFVESCPYAQRLCTVPSKMSKDYTVTMWLFSLEDRRG